MKQDRPPTRRAFLKMGATGIAAAAFLSFGTCSPQRKDARRKERKFVYRTLGRTGLKLPVVSMGSCYAIDLVGTALDEGIAYIHTSSGYAEGNHELLLREVFRDRPRDSFVIATSPDLPAEYARGRDRSLDIGRKADPERIPESLKRSLQRLGLDYVDIYYLVSVGSRDAVLFEPYMRAFETLKKSGMARFVGVGTHSNEPDVIRAAVESTFWDVVLTAFNFRQSYREDVRTAIHEAAEAGLGVVAMKTQAGVYWDPTRMLKINMKAALKWVLQDENVHTTIPAFSNYDEMYEGLSVMDDLTLTPAEEGELTLGDRLGLPGFYCQQCGSCLPQCPAGLDIPTLMHGHMVAFGYQKPRKARDTLRSWRPSEVACKSCAGCAVECALGLNVRAKALDIARFLEVPEEFFG